MKSKYNISVTNTLPLPIFSYPSAKSPYLCSMHYLSVENLTKSYADKPLFENLTFHVS